MAQVALMNNADKVFRDRWNGQDYEVEPGGFLLIDENIAKAWLGDWDEKDKVKRQDERHRAAGRRGAETGLGEFEYWEKRLIVKPYGDFMGEVQEAIRKATAKMAAPQIAEEKEEEAFPDLENEKVRYACEYCDDFTANHWVALVSHCRKTHEKEPDKEACAKKAAMLNG